MRFSTPIRAWLVTAICACAIALWCHRLRIQHLAYVSNAADTTASADAHSPTGYSGGVRQAIVVGRDADSFQWIEQTQQMAARGPWRIRHADYDNAPEGREVTSASLYRWWLAGVAWIDHTVSNRPFGQSVERATLFADPVLQLLFIVGTGLYIARRFGASATVAFGAAAIFLFPFGGAFIPGQPSDRGLQLIAAAWSVLPLLAALYSESGDTRARRDVTLAALAAAILLWMEVGMGVIVIAGLAVGALVIALLQRRASTAEAGAIETIPWRRWGITGAIVALAVYLFDYFPMAGSSWRLDVVHPVYAVAWAALGELLQRIHGLVRRPLGFKPRRELFVIVLAALVVALPAIIAWRNGRTPFAPDLADRQLTAAAGVIAATNLGAWIFRDGFNLAVGATLLPCLLAILAGIALLAWRGANLPVRARAGLALAFATAVVVASFAYFHLRTWSVVDAVLFATVVSGTAAAGRATRRPHLTLALAFALTLAAIVPGALLLNPFRVKATQAVSSTDIQELIERDLAQWLATEYGAGRPVVLASPDLAASLAFHGGFRALATPDRHNRDGLAAALRIAAATSEDEALAIVQRRKVTHIVLASWAPFLEQYTQVGSGKAEHSLIALLHAWQPPRWLRPVAYRMPVIPGFEGQSVVVFEVVELQENALALSHLAEYFAETGQLELAGSASDALARLFPDDLGAQIARVEVALASGDAGAANNALQAVQSQLAAGSADYLPWDRRVSLAIVLAQAKQTDAARAQVEKCLAEMDEPRLRSLSTAMLYRFAVLTKILQTEIPDPQLRELARTLLPPELRSRL